MVLITAFFGYVVWVDGVDEGIVVLHCTEGSIHYF